MIYAPFVSTQQNGTDHNDGAHNNDKDRKNGDSTVKWLFMTVATVNAAYKTRRCQFKRRFTFGVRVTAECNDL